MTWDRALDLSFHLYEQMSWDELVDETKLAPPAQFLRLKRPYPSRDFLDLETLLWNN